MKRETLLKIVQDLLKLMPVFNYENWAMLVSASFKTDVATSQNYSTGPPSCHVLNP